MNTSSPGSVMISSSRIVSLSFPTMPVTSSFVAWTKSFRSLLGGLMNTSQGWGLLLDKEEKTPDPFGSHASGVSQGRRAVVFHHSGDYACGGVGVIRQAQGATKTKNRLAEK